MDRSHCTGCGRPLAPAPGDLAAARAAGPGGERCAGCARDIDPPRYCPACGRWMAVTVSPTGWVARCRDHGELRPDGAAAN